MAAESTMPSPFPGMDPHLERPGLWPDVHNSLIAAIRDALAPALRPRYVVALEERVYVEEPHQSALVGRPDIAVVGAATREAAGAKAAAGPAVVEVEVPIPDRVRETYLVVRGVGEADVVTVLELLSPANKQPGEGRRVYLEKRRSVFATLTSLVEIDLLRSGERMPVVGAPPHSDYGILISRSWRRPKAELLTFGVRDPVPPHRVPLRRDDQEPTVDLSGLLSALYDRAGYDLRVDYRQPPEPPLGEADAAWAAALLRERVGAPRLD